MSKEPRLVDKFTLMDERIGRTNQLLEQLLQNKGVDVPGGGSGGSSSLEEGLDAFFSGNIINLPHPAPIVSSPAATESNPLVIDFDEGEVDVPGVGTFGGQGTDLSKLGVENASSGVVVPDATTEIRLFDNKERLQGEFLIPGNSSIEFGQTKISKVEVISSDQNFSFLMYLSTANTVSINATSIDEETNRFGYQASTPNQSEIEFTDRNIAQENINAVDWIVGSTDPAVILQSYQAQSVSGAVDSYGEIPLPSDSVVNEVWQIQNASPSNSIEVQIVGRDQDQEALVADTDIHPDTGLTNSITVSPGDVVSLESSLQMNTKYLRAWSTNANNPGTVRAQYQGNIPGGR